jgi:L-asparaginase II
VVSKAWGYQVGDVVELARLTRSDLVESRHFGLAVITDPDGNVLESHGNYRKLIYPRSALKPLQLIAMRRAGLDLPGELLAISTASHQGTKEHQALVLKVLDSVGLSEAELQCPVAWPSNIEARAKAKEKTKLAFNCSGKHAAFLASCVINGWDTSSYLDPSHPLQELTVSVIEEFSAEKISHSTVDGCGAPLHALSSKALAKAIGKASGSDAEVFQAMTQNAWVVGDHGAADSLLLDRGMLAKIGAEGVFVIGTASGYGVSVKVADGSLRPAALVGLKLLLNQGLIEPSLFSELEQSLQTRSLGGEVELGALELGI